jgi:hypothetical protein
MLFSTPDGFDIGRRFVWVASFRGARDVVWRGAALN